MRGWWLLSAGLAAAAAVVVAFGVLSTVTLVRIRRRAAPETLAPADAIVVFGAGVWPTGPSLTLRTRVDQAARLYHGGLAPIVFCSGSYSRGRSEARTMRALLVEQGVPADRIIPDDSGTSTRETLLSARDFGRGAWRRLIAVSSPYHLHRIAGEARRLGLITSTSPAPRPVPSTWRHRLFDGRQHARETIAVWRDTIAGGWRALFPNSSRWLPARALRHLRGRLAYLAGAADQVAAESERIGLAIRAGIASFSDVEAVLTPASGLSWPLAGRLGHGFGLRHRRLHAGLDVRAPHGSPVHAAAAGSVVFADHLPMYGNVVVLHHGGGLSTVYAHLAGIVAAPGEHLAGGDPVGFVGKTGHASGPHLHFEVRVHGSPVDPCVYLAQTPASPAARVVTP